MTQVSEDPSDVAPENPHRGADSTEKERTDESLDRRQFLQGMGAAGLAGAAGVVGFQRLGASGPSPGEGLRSPLVTPKSPQLTQEGPDEFPRPEGLREGTQLDCRWPMVYEETIPTALRLVTEHFAALSRQDLGALAETLHFPFAIVEQTDPIVVESPDDLMENPPMTLAPASMQVDHPGHFTGRIKEGSYNLFESIDVELFCLVGAVVSLSFMRYGPNGQKLARSEGIYAVTNNDGRWGIELVSTIMTPAAHLDVPHRDAEQAALRSGQDSMLRYTNRHRLPDEDEEPFYGRSARVSFGYGPRSRAGDARNGRPMAGWRTEGVTSRLSVSETTPEDFEDREPHVPDPENPQFTPGYEFDQFAGWAGGNVGEYGDTWTLPHQPRVIHADRQKAHTIGGYIRYTPDMTMISETRSVSIRVYRDGRWGRGGGIGQVTYHDRSNSYDL